jgi:hypothetical protein
VTYEGLLCLLVVFVELHLCINACLFPKHGDGTSDLHVGKTVVVDYDDLLCFAEVCHLSFGVQASSIIPCTALLERSPGNQVVLNLFP